MKIIIIGHQNPDTDSVVAALAYTELKNKIDFTNEYISATAGSLNNETKFVLNYFKIPVPKLATDLKNWEGKIIILDHTEPSQLPPGVDTDKIIEILDHHRLGGLQTPNQILARIEPVGSTSTIVAKIFKEKKVIPSKETASLLISGIISDTLFLQSPTTTGDDRNVLKELNKIAQIANLEDYANQMFEAKSDITGVLLSEIATKDYKEFQFGQKKVGIGVWETVKPESVLRVKDQLIEELKRIKTKDNLDLIYFLVVDILKQKSSMIIVGEEENEVAEKVFGGKTKDYLLNMGNIVSRKKEIVPPLERFLK